MPLLKKCKLQHLTWLKVGGEADFLYANDLDDLRYAIHVAQVSQKKLFVIGAGSNIFALDGILDIIVVKLGDNFNYIFLEGESLRVGCGALDSKVAKFALMHDLGGLEFLVAIPGTVGGAIAMNAGAYGSDVSMCLDSIKVMNMSAEVKVIQVSDMRYKYRGHGLTQNHIFLEAKFRANKCPHEAIYAKMTNMINCKTASQPIQAKTCGSFFKNPLGGRKAWQLIDDAGCRGMRVGDAQMSTRHCNFLINVDKATSNDISMLYQGIQDKVRNCFGINLELEVVLLA